MEVFYKNFARLCAEEITNKHNDNDEDSEYLYCGEERKNITNYESLLLDYSICLIDSLFILSQLNIKYNQ